MFLSFIKKIVLTLLCKRNKMFSKTCEYAIRAMIFIALKSKGGKKMGIKKQCSKTHPCPIHHEFKTVRKGLQQSSKTPNSASLPKSWIKACPS